MWVGQEASSAIASQTLLLPPPSVLSMGLKATAEEVAKMVQDIGGQDRLIQLDEFQDVSCGLLGRDLE